MSVAIALIVVVVLVTAAVIAYTTWFLAGPGAGDGGELAGERARLRAGLGAALARVPVAVRTEEPPPELADAEARVAASPDDGRARALLAHALLERGDVEAAAAEAARAAELGGGGAPALVVEGRAAAAAAARAAGVDPLAPGPLLAPGELAILQRERARRQAGESTPAPVAAHLRRYHHALDRLLAALELEPDRLDALHEAGRLAIKVGLIDEGRALLERLEPLAAGTPAEAGLRRDLAQLRTDDLAGVSVQSDRGRRSPRLRIVR
jgi:tetratricopeptide (TPR) repeat protein